MNAKKTTATFTAQLGDAFLLYIAVGYNRNIVVNNNQQQQQQQQQQKQQQRKQQ